MLSATAPGVSLLGCDVDDLYQRDATQSSDHVVDFMQRRVDLETPFWNVDNSL